MTARETGAQSVSSGARKGYCRVQLSGNLTRVSGSGGTAGSRGVASGRRPLTRGALERTVPTYSPQPVVETTAPAGTYGSAMTTAAPANTASRTSWIDVCVVAGSAMFILALTVAAIFAPQWRVLHVAQALIYVAVIVLAR